MWGGKTVDDVTSIVVWTLIRRSATVIDADSSWTIYPFLFSLRFITIDRPNIAFAAYQTVSVQ